MTPRLAIVRYKLAARAYRRRKIEYRELESARAVMLASLGYDRAYSYMGEFCNLHERDFPGNIHAANNPRYYDERGRRMGGGRYYQFSGWHMAITWEEHAANMTRDRERARYLQSMFLLPPVERFIRGWSVVYPGLDGKSYMAAWRPNSDCGLPYMTVVEIAGMFDRRLRMQPIMGENQARSFFANLPDPAFQENYRAATEFARPSSLTADSGVAA